MYLTLNFERISSKKVLLGKARMFLASSACLPVMLSLGTYFILCRYMKEAAASSEKDDEGSEDVSDSLSAEKVEMSKTVIFFISSLLSDNLLKDHIENFRDELENR